MNKYKKKSQLMHKNTSFYLNKIIFSVIIILVLTGCSSLPKKSEPMTERYKAAQSTYSLGTSQYGQGLYESAFSNFESALFQFSSLDVRKGVVQSLLSMGQSALALGEYEKTLNCYQWSLPFAEDLNDKELLWDVANHFCNYYLAMDDLNLTREWTSYGLEPEDDSSEIVAERYRILGTIAKRESHYSQALDWYQKANEVDKAQTDSIQVGTNYYLSGSAYSLMGDYSRAEEFLLMALDKDRYYESLPGIAADLSALGVVLERDGRLEEAVLYYERAYLAWKGLKREDKTADLSAKITNIKGELLVFP